MDMVCILFCKSQMAEVIVFSTNTWGAEPQGFIQSPGQPRICRGTLPWNKSKNKWREGKRFKKVSVEQRLAKEEMEGITSQVEERINFRVWMWQVTDKVE